MKPVATAMVVSALALAAAWSTPALAQTCEQQTFEKAGYVVCSVKPAEPGLKLFWQDAENQPYRSFGRLADAVAAKGKRLDFAMNAGMYRPDFAPIGLYVEDGRELRPADTTAPPKGAGPVPNFYKAPNGVFFVGDTTAGILPTRDFLKRRPNVRLATQSGPVLVIRGKLNPIFILGSTDRTRRSGVGICGDAVRFAISDEPVNFHDFARLFRDHLKCADALFLDGGNGTGLYDPALGRQDFSWHGGYGPMIGMVK